MRSKIVEATDGGLWLKAMVAVFDDDEWHRGIMLDDWSGPHLLLSLGWTRAHFWLLDLATGNGAILRMGDQHAGHGVGSGCSCHRVADVF